MEDKLKKLKYYIARLQNENAELKKNAASVSDTQMQEILLASAKKDEEIKELRARLDSYEKTHAKLLEKINALLVE
ncbi:MAG: hypothetical protein ACTTIC_04670 [Helicobacteraceae bacterium]